MKIISRTDCHLFTFTKIWAFRKY